MRALALWLLGGAAAAPLSRQRTSLERAGDRDAQQLGASAPSSDGGICDPSWCSCNRCEAQALDPGSCNLCEQRWVFVLSAGGRSGSTSLLEGLNALPGVSLSGENLGLLSEMQLQFAGVDGLVSKNEAGNSAAFHLPQWRGQRRHALCAQQSIMASLAGGNASLAAAYRDGPQPLRTGMGGRGQIFGFKELIELRSFEADGPFPGEYPHLEVSGQKREWVRFLDELFPCSRLVLNLRRDTAAQARAILSSFGSSQKNFAHDPFGDATPPLTLIERDIEEASRFILELHKNKSATGRSFLVYTEDMTAGRFSQLAQWLDRPCTFDLPPTANEPDPSAQKGYFGHSAPVKVSCEEGLLPAGPHAPEELRKYTETVPNASPAGEYTSAYEKLVNDAGSDDDECGEVELLPHNEVCAAQPPPSRVEEYVKESRAELLPVPQLDLDHDLGDLPLSSDAWAERLGVRATEVSPPTPDASSPLSSDPQSDFLRVSDLPSFYLHDDDPYNFSDSVACLLNATGLRGDVDAFDEQLIPDMAEHMVDWWLLKRFERHPARVHDPDAAQLHVIGSPFRAAYLAHRGNTPGSCGNLRNFYARTAAIATHLERTSWWRQHGGRNFLLLNSFYHLNDVLGKELLSTLVSGPAIFTSSDRSYVDFLAINRTVTPTIVPYKAHYRLEDFAWLQADHAQPRVRTSSVMFHGSSGRGYEEGQLRQLICDRLGPQLAGHALRCVKDEWKQEATADLHTAVGPKAGGEESQAGGTDASHQMVDTSTLEAYVSSKVCLVPAGDTPTSRRLFDSMAAGCLPVLMAPAEDIMPNLPFPKAIDWPKTVLLGGGLGCSLRDNADATIRWLQSLLEPENEKKLQCMARRAQKVFLKHLTLRDEGVVSALLHEIDLGRALGADAASDAGGSREPPRPAPASAPASGAASAPASGAGASAPAWLLEPATPGVQPRCPAGRRGATEEECFAAAQEAAQGAGLQVNGAALRTIDEGPAGVVPAGCSYSVRTGAAMFNTGVAGDVGQGNYRVVCR